MNSRIGVGVTAALLLLSGFPARVASASSTVACTPQRLSQYVSPYGIRQPWPVAEQLPQSAAGDLGVLLSEPGTVLDGYEHRLYVDAGERAAYVVEQGGIAGRRKVYGPLPIASCPAPSEFAASITLSYKGKPFGAPTLAVKNDIGASVAVSEGPSAYALSLTVSEVAQDRIEVTTSVESRYGNFAPTLVVRPGEPATFSVGDLGLTLTVDRKGG